MINCHSTATCPSCNKDSYQSEYAAFFSIVECTWCGSKFTWDSETKSYKVVIHGHGDKKYRLRNI